MKLVGYVRVSTEGQADNTSLEDQQRRIEAYCTAFGHELVRVFVEVASGTKMKNRHEFQAALEFLTAGGADGIIAIRLDRIARNTRDVLALVEDTLQPNNKSLVLLDLNVDTSNPTGRMVLTVMAAVAQLEWDNIYERTQGGRKAKAAKGGYAYGSPKFGEVSQDGELVPDDSEQAVIELIRRHRKSGKSFAAIADYLNAHGYPAKRGGQWAGLQVKRVCDRLKAKA